MTHALQTVLLTFIVLCFAECILAQRLPTFTCEFQGQFYYVVSVRDGTQHTSHICGGVVIASNAVLTAAHCIDRSRNSAATVLPDVYIGGPIRDHPIESRRTVLSIPHPDWNGILEDGNNLAILKLEEETCVEPIPQLGAEDAQNHRDLPFLGYGRTGNTGDHSHQLMGALFNIHNASYCNERYEVDPPLTDRELCARGQNTVGMCNGDEGSPMILIPTFKLKRDVLIGLASFTTASCGNTEGVSVFMNIMHYRDWINETLQSDRFINA